MNKYIVTTVEFDGCEYIFGGFYRDGVLDRLCLTDPASCSMTGNIYCGKVESVHKNIGGSFVNTKDGKIFVPETGMKAGQDTAVQVKGGPSGSKHPRGTTSLRLAGNTAVVLKGSGNIMFSTSLSEEQKSVIRKWMDDIDLPEFDLIVRYNAVAAEKKVFTDEVRKLAEELRSIEKRAAFAVSGALLYKEKPLYLRELLSVPFEEIDEVVTDNNVFYDEMAAYDDLKGKLRVYTDDYPLTALYNTDRDLKRLSSKHVYLRSGAFLVIEKTEAFVSVDVNSGKQEKGRAPQETYRKINIEAAKEIARQIRLRNLSGMILVDFINLRSQEMKKELINTMRNELKKDSNRGKVIDITPLGIMEIVREKKEQALFERSIAVDE